MTQLSQKSRGSAITNRRLAITMISVFILSIWVPKASGGGPDINQGAKRGTRSQNYAMAINTAAGIYFTAKCHSKRKWACPLAVMSFKQAAEDAMASAQSDQVYKATEHNLSFDDVDPFDGVDPSYGVYSEASVSTKNAGTRAQFIKIKNELKKLKKMGYKVNPEKGTVTTPKGEVPMSAFNSSQGMAAAGYDKASIAAAQSAIKKLNADAAAKYGETNKVISIGMASHGGGNMGHYGSMKNEVNFNTEEDPTMAAYLSSLKKKMRRKRDPSSLSGMKRMANGEPIGVAMDNIFEMVHRRYQKKRQENLFIEVEIPKK